MTPEEAVSKAAEIIGSQYRLAKKLGVSPPTVNQWVKGAQGRPVPPKRALQIERLTDGAVSRRDLCPSFPWDEVI